MDNKSLLRYLPIVGLLVLASCARPPEYYPPPEQRTPIEGADPGGAPEVLIGMGDTNATAHFVKDISLGLEGGSWRWTGQRPTLRVLLVTTKNLKFMTDFTLWEGAMTQTGPVTMSFYVGDHLLDRVRYETPGYKHFEKPVPAEWLQTATDTEIAMEIDKVYVSPNDGAKFGFILSQIGFVN